MKRALAAVTLLLALAIAGCGGSSGAGPGDPAQIAPQTTLAYATFEIRPQADAKPGFDAAFGKLLGADPESKLGEAFTKAAQTSGKLDYLQDVKPWLGDSLSVIVTKAGRRYSDYALLAASTDDDKARAAIDKDVGGKSESAEYRGVSYAVLPDGTANGVVGHFLVAGTEPAFKAVVDTEKDGHSLADSDQWQQSVGDRGDGKVGLAYVDVKGLLQSFMSGLPGLQRLAGPLLLSTVQLHPFVATLDAQEDSLVVDVSSPGTKPDPRGPGAASTPLINSLPADSWLAAGVPDVGASLSKLLAGLEANPLFAAQIEKVTGRLKAQTRVDLQKELLPAISDVAVFMRGTTKRTLGGGLVIESDSPTTVTGAGKALLGQLPPDAARRVRMANSGDRAVIAVGEPALRAARRPAQKLGDTESFNKAQALVGQRPTLFVDFQRALALAANSPHHKNDAHFRRALPRLRHVEYVAAGARREGGLDVIRGVVGLR